MVMVVILACTNLVSDSSLTSLLKFLADGDRLLSSAVIELVYLDIHLQGGVYLIYTPPIEQSDWLECYNHGTNIYIYIYTSRGTSEASPLLYPIQIQAFHHIVTYLHTYTCML